ncbi:hypothetical protein QP963_11630, partial [Corynebacterium coyleae]|nr:hypothetical protein [Corynebacterium coyleae]MDK8708032.1 hypothetical protein [Corynebacterium coyleae]MDK8734881.1 hypothetical protein [Corynebacterium coyleae]MDK8894075.1 hypothetical protein [Corynebacterium coyleae]
MDFLRTHRHLYSIERMCRVLNEHEYAISPATFYRFQARGFGPTPAELDEAYTAHRLFELWHCQMRVFGTGVPETRYCCVPGSWYRGR